MEQSEILSNLCYYDIRNPQGAIDDLSPEEIKEMGLIKAPKKDCYCDNCFYGRTKLALHILTIINN